MRVAIWQCFAPGVRLTLQSSVVRAVAAAIFFAATGAAMGQQYDPGASAVEIKLGQTVPFSGPVSVAGVVGYASRAYFDALNKAGGINGRQVRLIGTR